MENRYTVGDDGDIYDNGKWMVEHAVDRLNSLEADNAQLKARRERLESGAELAWYELGRLLSKWRKDWTTGDIDAVESVISNLDAALKDGE